MEQVFNQLVSVLVPFVVLVFGLVEFLKAAFKLEGPAVTWTSFGVGAVFGVIVFVATLWPGTQVYLAGLVFVCASGLVASGYYKFFNERLPRVNG
jgi:hypothetical protein